MNESSSSVDKGDFKYENQFFSLQDIYRLLGFSTDPTDRELEAKIIMYMRKYNGYKSGEDDRRLYDFFDRLYDHLFDTNENDVEIVEGFVSQSSSIGVFGAGAGATGGGAGGGGGATGGATGGSSGGAGAGGGAGGAGTGGAGGAGAGGGSGGAGAGSGGAGAGGGSSGAGGAGTGSVVQTVNPVSYSKDNLNPILKQTIQRVISIDSRYRNLNRISTSINSLATNFTIELSEPLRDVLSLKLYSYQIPFTWYTVNKDFGSNFFIIKGNVPGIDEDGYKIEIEPGNYSAITLTSTINAAIKTMALEYTDVSFGNTKLTYNVNTTVATFTIDIQKSYQESQFELDWVNWASPYSGIDRETSYDKISNIPQYLGFDYQKYNLNSINSVRDVLPILSNSQTDDNRNSIYFINRQDTSANNYFKVISYSPNLKQVGSIWSVNSYADVSNNPASKLNEITITLDLEEGGYTRNEIETEVQRQILISPYFLQSGSSLTRQDQKNDLNSFFNLSLVLNRSKFPFTNSSKTVVVFPNETGAGGIKTGYNPIWSGLNSCFNFDLSFVELNDIVAEYPLFPANYVIQGTPIIEFTVVTPGYTNNIIRTYVINSDDVGYTYEQYIQQINNAFSNNIRLTINDIPYLSTDLNFGTLKINNVKPFYFDSVSSLPRFTFDLNYTFNTNNYKSVQFYNIISINDISFALIQNGNGNIGSNIGILNGYTEFNYLNNYGFSFDLSQNIPSNSTFIIKYGFKEDNFLKIIPNNTNYAASFEIPFIATPNYINSSYRYSDFDTFISDILKSIRGFNTTGDNSYPLRSSSIIKEKVQVENGIQYNIKFNIVIEKNISQQECSLKLYDKELIVGTTYLTNNTGVYSSGAPYSSWGSYLNFTDSSYNLSSSSTISGTKSIQASTLITLTKSNNFFYFRPQDYASGLVTAVSGSYLNSKYNDIFFSFNTGTYSINSLFDALNVAFSNNEVTRGTNIRYVSKGTKNYCVLRTNINRIFYSKDYSLNFYDLTSFVKCYVGSSARNTTWDSTIGWILGFHDKTVYELSSYDYIGTTNSIKIIGELSVNTNLFSYFLISVDDFNQNRLNDGLVTITRPEQQASLPSYSAIADFTTDFNEKTGTSGSSVVAENNLTAKQVYSINQVLESRKYSSKIYSQGPFVKDIFGYIPLKLPSTPGDMITEYGGTLQNQDRLYFGPVNIRRLQVQLINDKGTVMDLNGADWSFSFICEQLYQKKMT